MYIYFYIHLVSPGRCATNGPATTHVRLYSAGRGPGVRNQDQAAHAHTSNTSMPSGNAHGHTSRCILVVHTQDRAVYA